MTSTQKMIVVLTLAFVAVFFHILFCDWKTGNSFQTMPKNNYYRDTIVIPIKPVAGILARSSAARTVDAILGVAFPVTFLATGLFLLARPKPE